MSLPWWVETKGSSFVEEYGGRKNPSVATVKREVSMARVLKHYGAPAAVLERFEDEWIAIPCPFHSDRRPSASYNYRHQRFRCHTCDVGGDVIDVVAHAEGLTTREALEWIAKNFL